MTLAFEYECICRPSPTPDQAHSPACVFTNRMRAEGAARAEGLDATPLIATIPDGALAPWKRIAAQHPESGPKGIHYESLDPGARWGGGPDGHRIDALLYYDWQGHLRGVLYYYQHEFGKPGRPGHQRAGTINMWVDPVRQRRGIGRELATAAIERWPGIDLAVQEYTEGGLAMAVIANEVRAAG